MQAPFRPLPVHPYVAVPAQMLDLRKALSQQYGDDLVLLARSCCTWPVTVQDNVPHQQSFAAAEIQASETLA